jgi:toxin ParE1/3/4
MKFRQLRPATAEVREAMAWYRVRSLRSMENFWLRMQDARRSIALFPLAAPLVAARTRRFILTGFPYDLIYSVLADEIVIVAVSHHSREPGYWKDRLRALDPE